MVDLLRELARGLGEGGVERAYLSESCYAPKVLTGENAHEFKRKEGSARIAFIDGGNAELLSSPSFSLNFVRATAIVMQGNSKKSVKTIEFYLLARIVEEGGKLFYSAKCTSEFIPGRDLMFNIEDETLKSGVFRGSISRLGEIARRFAELKLASETEADIIVLDGTLQAAYTNELTYLNRLYSTAGRKIICALAKSCSVVTTRGNSLMTAISALAPTGCFYYHPIAEIKDKRHNAEMFACRLHEASDFIFRVEVCKDTPCDPNMLFPLLAANSVDPVFLGYPYGLYMADKLARVSDVEASNLKARVIAESGSKWNEIRSQILDAHDVLDGKR